MGVAPSAIMESKSCLALCAFTLAALRSAIFQRFYGMRPLCKKCSLFATIAHRKGHGSPALLLQVAFPPMLVAQLVQRFGDGHQRRLFISQRGCGPSPKEE